MKMTQMPPPTRKDLMLETIERELERIYPNALEKHPSKMVRLSTLKDIVIFRSQKFKKLVNGLTTKHLTGIISQMKCTPVWS